MADESILTSIKKSLGLTEDYEEFDSDIIMLINTSFATLNQLAVGPDTSLFITDKSANWSDFIENQTDINSVKTYVYLKTKLVFDPPATSFLITAFENMAKEFEWRLNVVIENQKPLIPTPDGSKEAPWDLTGGLEFPPQAKDGDFGIDYVSGDVWRYSNG